MLIKYWPQPVEKLTRLSETFLLCRKPIAYSIGSIDPKFQISSEEVGATALQAEKIWEDVVSRNLFEYRDGAKLTISLEYDDRQALTQQSGEISGDIESKQQLYDSLKAKYQRLVADFEPRLQRYNEQVAYWNSQGGATREEYERLQEEARQLNRQADEINGLAQQLNTLARQLNIKVGQFNTVAGKFNETLAVKPEAGRYSPSQGAITIYQFSDRNDLRLTLAHEFGHALNIDHLDRPNALMNPQRSVETQLTQADIQALKQLCRIQ